MVAGMGKASGLFVAAVGAASLVVACAIPWQESADLDMFPLPRSEVSITPGGETGTDAGTGAGQTVARPEEPALVPEVATLAPRTALGSPPKASSLPVDRISLGRELQRELARVGCYDGEISGIWTPSARKAMNAFTDRVNATLPTDEPDYILLTLVQGHKHRVCGMTCPEGQGLAEGGRCVPSAILAARKSSQAARVAPARPDLASPSAGWSVTRMPNPASPGSASEERMGLAGTLAPPPGGPTDGNVPLAAAAINAPGQPAPAPAGTAATARPADAARRAANGRAPFGPTIFRQWDRY